MRQHSPLRIAPGQSRPLAFDIMHSSAPSVEISLKIMYKLEHSPEVIQGASMKHTFHPRETEVPQKITYLHPAGIVSYAVLRPPSKKALHHVEPKVSLPVVLGLHGAGVETDSSMIRHALDDAPDLRGWVLFPSGGTTWSGDDWR